MYISIHDSSQKNHLLLLTCTSTSHGPIRNKYSHRPIGNTNTPMPFKRRDWLPWRPWNGTSSVYAVAALECPVLQVNGFCHCDTIFRHLQISMTCGFSTVEHWATWKLGKTKTFFLRRFGIYPLKKFSAMRRANGCGFRERSSLKINKDQPGTPWKINMAMTYPHFE